jgi:ABC-2 type transport system ATP-binding protein
VGGERKREIGYLPEERGLYRTVKVIEALAYFAELKGMSAKAARAAAMAWLERVELADVAQQKVQTLSKGMQQKVQLCTALIGDPRLLILDEPFSGLDPVNVRLLEDILDERRRAGCTVLLSTHQMNKVEELCDRALMINHGHMVLYGTVSEIRRQHAGHAVVVGLAGGRAAAGAPVPEELQGLRGVREVEREDSHYLLKLEPEATRAEILRSLLERGLDLEHFATATLPLEDVFVMVVREGRGLDRGASATLDAPAAPTGARP